MIEACSKSFAWYQDWSWNHRSSLSQQIPSASTLPAVAQNVVASASEPEKKGSFLGWLSCAFSGMNFTGGGKYDEYTGQCTMQGEFIRMMHGR